MPHANEHLTDGVEGGVYFAQTVDSTPVAVATTPATGQRFYLTDIIATNVTGVAQELTLTSGTQDLVLNLAAAVGAGFQHSFRKPFRFTTGTINASTLAGEVNLVVVGFWLPTPSTL